jgi:hypothetical protein
VRGPNADADGHMIGYEMPFHDFVFLLLRQLMQHLPEMLSYHSKNRLLTPLRDKHNVIFTIPMRVREALVLFRRMVLFPGRNGSIYDRPTRSNSVNPPAKPGGLTQLVIAL